ncbi:MAG TPA: hypothetical protein VHE83_19135 [Mycobacteriales bacterium]|nr:hypothetical protein [Mycobacteriales bacterium]
MSRREPHIPVRHQRTRVLDNQLARIGAREPVETSDALLVALADLVADVDMVVDRVAPSPVPLVDRSEATGDVLPVADADDDVRPLVRRRQTWSVVSAAGIAASFVAAGLLASSSTHPAVSTPSLSAAAETKQLLTHATQILPSAKASDAAHTAYARELTADLDHAASLLPQVQDPQARASLARQLATLQQQVPAPVASPPPTAHPSPSASTARPRTNAPAPMPTTPRGATSTTRHPPGQPTDVRSGAGAPSQPSRPVSGQPQPPTGAQPPAGEQPPPAGQQPPRQQNP